MIRLILFLLFIFFSLNIYANKLSPEEFFLFNFVDINKDKLISLDEITKSIKLIFTLIDKNSDGNLSENELQELKNILEF